MANLVNKAKALKTLKNYFFLLEKVGYVKHDTIKKYMVYLFLLDFVEYTGEFLTEDDYILIDRLIKRTFMNGGCLLPYPLNCTNSAYVGKADITNG